MGFQEDRLDRRLSDQNTQECYATHRGQIASKLATRRFRQSIRRHFRSAHRQPRYGPIRAHLCTGKYDKWTNRRILESELFGTEFQREFALEYGHDKSAYEAKNWSDDGILCLGMELGIWT